MSAMVAIASSDIRFILFSNFVLVYQGAQYEWMNEWMDWWM